MVAYSRLEQNKSDRRNAAPRGLQRTVSPHVISIESTVIRSIKLWKDGRRCGWEKNPYLWHSMSIRCCSATLFSLFTFLCKAVNMVFFSNKFCPQLLFKSSMAWLAIPCASVASGPPRGGMAKYSNSSRRTIIACFERRGFWACAAAENSELGGRVSNNCCWRLSNPGWLCEP